MSTLVCFHAHPDDEAISTGGSMAKASAAGHRVVLVVATGGEYGETPSDLAPEESLRDRRRVETENSAAALGIHRVVWLGYRDSGMHGWEQNADPLSFHQAPIDEAAARLAEILLDERADVLTTYDWHGNYGHPDHVKVHQVGNLAGSLAATPVIYEATMNRDALARFMEAARAAGEMPEGPPQTDDGNPFGSPETDLTTAVDVTGFLGAKRAALRAHASQISDTSFFLTMPDEVFATAFGTEWFIRRGAPGGIHESDLAELR